MSETFKRISTAHPDLQSGKTPLLVAVSTGASKEMVQLLIDAGETLNAMEFKVSFFTEV